MAKRDKKASSSNDASPIRTGADGALIVLDAHVPATQDPLDSYMAQLRQLEPLSADDQQGLAERYHADGDVEAAQRLVMSNLRLVVKIAREYGRRRDSLMELIQEGNVGLAEAIRRYDPYRGVKFTSYAQYWIRAMILNYLMNVMQMVRVGNTRSGRRLFYNLQKAREALLREGFPTPTARQLADHLGVRESEVVDVSRILDGPPQSLDAPLPGQEHATLGMTLSDEDAVLPEEAAVRSDLRERIREALDAFRSTLHEERDVAIWDERVTADDPLSLQELGERFDVSRERIRQIERALKERFQVYWVEEVGREEAAFILESE